MNEIRRSTGSQLSGPPPTAHQVRELHLKVEALGHGRFRLSTPQARGWAMVVRTPHELARALAGGFTEVQLASYARWRGERPELDALTEPVPGDPLAPPRPPQRRAVNTAEVGWGQHQRRPDSHDPADWVKMPDGRWQSPGGKNYPETSKVVQMVLRRRNDLGLPC